MAYKAFGEEVVNSGTGEKPPYTYTGKERDASGLMYYGARYYDPALARFITPDTVSDAGTQGLNRYSYALNHPLRYTDPSGHQAADQAFQRWIDSNPLERVGLTDPGPFTPLLPYLEGNETCPRSLFGTDQFYIELTFQSDVRGVDVAAMSLDDLDQLYVTTAISHAKTIGLALPAAHLGTMRGLSRSAKSLSLPVAKLPKKVFTRGIDQQLDYLMAKIPGLNRQQARFLLVQAYQRNSTVVFGGSRIRGNYRENSDLDVGFGSLSKRQAQRLIHEANKLDGLHLEDKIVIAPEVSTKYVSPITSPEEFFQRAGLRAPSDEIQGQYVPSGSVTVAPDGTITIIPAGGQ